MFRALSQMLSNRPVYSGTDTLTTILNMLLWPGIALLVVALLLILMG